MDKIVKQEIENEDEELFMAHITIKSEPGTSEVLVKQEAGNEDEESFMSRITIKNEPGTSEVKQEAGNEEESFKSYIAIKNEPRTSEDLVKQDNDCTNARNQSHRENTMINKYMYTNSSVLVAKEIPLKTEYAEDGHHDGAKLSPKPPPTDFISWAVRTEDYVKKDMFECTKLINNGENKDIVLHSTDTVKKDIGVSKTGLDAVSEAVKVETHLNGNTTTRNPICELNIAREQNVLTEKVTSEFPEDHGQETMVKPVKDKSLTQIASKAQKLNLKGN